MIQPKEKLDFEGVCVNDERSDDDSVDQQTVTGKTWIDVVLKVYDSLVSKYGKAPIIICIGIFTLFLVVGIFREHKITEPGDKVVFVGLQLWTKSVENRSEYVNMDIDDLQVDVYSRSIDQEIVIETLIYNQLFPASEIK